MTTQPTEDCIESGIMENPQGNQEGTVFASEEGGQKSTAPPLGGSNETQEVSSSISTTAVNSTSSLQSHTTRATYEGYVNVEDIDDDRDVAVDMLDSTPHRRVYRRLVQVWATRYRFVKRGDKTRVVEQACLEMEQQGVRFLVSDHSPQHFGRRLAIENNSKKVRNRIQRCIREYNRSNGTDKTSQYSGSASMAPSYSACSTTSSIRTSTLTPPVQQVSVPLPRPVPIQPRRVEQPARIITVGAPSNQNDNNSAIQEVAVPNYKMAPKSGGNVSLASEASTTRDGNDFTLGTGDSTLRDNETLAPPNFERFTESWASIMANMALDFSNDTADPSVLEPVAAANGDTMSRTSTSTSTSTTTTTTTSTSNNNNRNKRNHEVTVMDDVPLWEPESQRCRVSTQSAIESVATGGGPVAASAPIWIHLSRHLTVLERRLEMVEQDNQNLRRLLAEQQTSTTTTWKPALLSELWTCPASPVPNPMSEHSPCILEV